MKEQPTISVIMPVYKTPEEFLRSSIESVLKQTITNFELILVEDGSQIIVEKFVMIMRP